MPPDTTVLQTETIAPTQGEWSKSVTFAPFNPFLGTLVDVQIGITSEVTGSVSVENLSPAVGTIAVALDGDVNVYGPDGGWITNSQPTATAGATLGAFDGTIDYGGSSGATLAQLLGTASTLDFDQPGSAGLAAFIGGHPVTLMVTGGDLGLTESGPGNLQTLSDAETGAVVTLQYDYINGGSLPPSGFTAGSTDYGIMPYFPFDWIGNSITTGPQTFVAPDSATDWTKDFSITQFNPALGTLEAVNISVTGAANTTVEAANLGATSAFVDTTQITTFTLVVQGSTSDLIIATTPVNESLSLGANDGNDAFTGNSGTIVQGHAATPGVSAWASELQLTSASDLALFTGTGTETLDFSADGTSQVSGSADLLTQLLDQAGGTVTVSYVYSTPDISNELIGGDPLFVWTGASNTDLASAANWNNVTDSENPAPAPPSPTDTAEFLSSGGVLTGSETIGIAQFGSGGLWSFGAGASLTADGSIVVGNGAVTVNGGATLASEGSTDTIAGTGGTSAEVTVTGTNALWSSAGNLLVGDSGIGVLSVQSDGTAVSNASTIANAAAASGSSATVTGPGSSWHVAGALDVGNQGAGSLSISSGATVSAGSVTAGLGSSGDGVISVSGGASALSTTGSLVVGAAGAGELSILSGATVSIGGDLDIGEAAGSSGNVDIEDAAGTVYVNGNLNLGAGGPGVLTLGPTSTLVLEGGINGGPGATLNLFTTIDPNPYSDNTTDNISGAFNPVQTQPYPAYVAATTFNLSHGLDYTLDTPVIEDGSSFVLGVNGADANAYTLVLNAGTFSADSSVTFENALGTLVIGIDQLATIDVPASGTGPFTPEANPSLGELLIGGFSGEIDGYQTGDRIEVDTYLSSASAATLSVNGSVVSVVEVANGATLGVLTFDSAAHAQAAVADDAITVVPCFAAGTRIATERGEVAVEVLRVGERVRTVLGGGLAPIVWVGRRRVDCARHPRPRKVWPVRVRAGALGADACGRRVPARDLWLSPDHALYLNGVLVPVKRLVNGTTIAQVAVAEITYYHVELAAHDVVLAEGLATESYLETGERANFAHGGAVVRQFPDFAARAWDALGCAPLVVSGPQLDAAQALVRAAVAPAAA